MIFYLERKFNTCTGSFSCHDAGRFICSSPTFLHYLRWKKRRCKKKCISSRHLNRTLKSNCFSSSLANSLLVTSIFAFFRFLFLLVYVSQFFISTNLEFWQVAPSRFIKFTGQEYWSTANCILSSSVSKIEKKRKVNVKVEY